MVPCVIDVQCLLSTWRVKEAVHEGGTILIPVPRHSTEIVHTWAEHVSENKDLSSASPATAMNNQEQHCEKQFLVVDAGQWIA